MRKSDKDKASAAGQDPVKNTEKVAARYGSGIYSNPLKRRRRTILQTISQRRRRGK